MMIEGRRARFLEEAEAKTLEEEKEHAIPEFTPEGMRHKQ